jgi:putative ABC transport system permease protein
VTSFRLALSNLLHDRGRTAVSAVGAGFAVVLIFMQLGFLGSVQSTATLLFDRLDFDVIVTSSEYLDLSRPGTVQRARLAQAASAAGVAEVLPLSVGQGLWRNPTDDPRRGGRRWQIQILGVDPGRLEGLFLPAGRGVFRDADDLAEKRALLGRTGTVLFDRRSRPDYGAAARMPPGTVTELNGRRVELTGTFEVGTGFSYNGLLLVNEETFGDVTGRSPREVTFGLVKVNAGESPDAVAARVRAALPSDVRVFTRDELNAVERRFWVSSTAVGTFFRFGVALALTVGAIFVYQMMVADIKKHLPEYATLKAVGYRPGYLFGVVVWQAVFLSVGGYVGGVVVALGLYEVARASAQLPIGMTGERMLIVLGLSVGMCVGSGLAAVRKVQHADPADLF